MKTNAIFFFIMMMSAMTYGQMNPQFQSEEMQISPPEFPALENCYKDLETNSINDYLSNKVKYARVYTGSFLPGTEVIAFVVTPTGELTGFRVINSVSPAIDDEMVRVLKGTSGNWTPGFINGEPVAMDKEVSLVFIPHDDYNIVKEAKCYLEKGNKILFVKKNPKRALKWFNEAFRLRPNKECILASRSICKYEMGDVQGAIRDCSRIIELNSFDGIQLAAIDPIDLLDQLRGSLKLSYFANNLK